MSIQSVCISDNIYQVDGNISLALSVNENECHEPGHEGQSIPVHISQFRNQNPIANPKRPHFLKQ